MTGKTETVAKSGNFAGDAFDLVAHAAQQMKKEQQTAVRVADVTKQLEAVQEKLRRTRERQKAAERDQRLIRPSVVTSKGALAAHVLLKAFNSAGGQAIVNLVDQMIADSNCAEAERIRELRGMGAVTVNELADWLGIPMSAYGAEGIVVEQNDQQTEGNTEPGEHLPHVDFSNANKPFDIITDEFTTVP